MHARMHYRLELAGRQIEIRCALNFETKELQEENGPFSKHSVVAASCFRDNIGKKAHTRKNEGI